MGEAMVRDRERWEELFGRGFGEEGAPGGYEGLGHGHQKAFGERGPMG